MAEGGRGSVSQSISSRTFNFNRVKVSAQRISDSVALSFGSRIASIGLANCWSAQEGRHVLHDSCSGSSISFEN